jgi:hypothetical protein
MRPHRQDAGDPVTFLRPQVPCREGRTADPPPPRRPRLFDGGPREAQPGRSTIQGERPVPPHTGQSSVSKNGRSSSAASHQKRKAPRLARTTMRPRPLQRGHRSLRVISGPGAVGEHPHNRSTWRSRPQERNGRSRGRHASGCSPTVAPEMSARAACAAAVQAPGGGIELEPERRGLPRLDAPRRREAVEQVQPPAGRRRAFGRLPGHPRTPARASAGAIDSAGSRSSARGGIGPSPRRLRSSMSAATPAVARLT